MHVKAYLRGINACVISLAWKAIVDLKDRCLWLKWKDVELFKTSKRCGSLRILDCWWIPAPLKQLCGMWKSQVAVTEVKGYRMNTRTANDNKIVVERSFRARAALPDRMAKLDTQSECLQSCFLKVVTYPLLCKIQVKGLWYWILLDWDMPGYDGVGLHDAIQLNTPYTTVYPQSNLYNELQALEQRKKGTKYRDIRLYLLAEGVHAGKHLLQQQTCAGGYT